jgi:hypothetical protein
MDVVEGVDWVYTLLMNLVVADVYWRSIFLVCEDVP